MIRPASGLRFFMYKSIYVQIKFCTKKFVYLFVYDVTLCLRSNIFALSKSKNREKDIGQKQKSKTKSSALTICFCNFEVKNNHYYEIDTGNKSQQEQPAATPSNIEEAV